MTDPTGPKEPDQTPPNQVPTNQVPLDSTPPDQAPAGSTTKGADAARQGVAGDGPTHPNTPSRQAEQRAPREQSASAKGDPSPLSQNDPVITLRDEENSLTEAFIDEIEAAVEAHDGAFVRQRVGDLHEAEVGDLITALPSDSRTAFIRLVGDAFDYTALTELDETIRLQILDVLQPQDVAKGIEELQSDDQVYLLEGLEEADKSAILRFLPFPERARLERRFDYEEDTAGRRMQSEFIAVPPFWSVGQTIDYLREAQDLPQSFYEIFVIDPRYQLVGTVPLNILLRAKRPVRMAKILQQPRHMVKATDDQEEVARLFERYNLVSTGVLDDANRLVGVMTVDDIVDVIQQEADEDIRRMGGVGDEEISDSVVQTARSRFTWLVVNLLTAVVASVIIALFDAPIEQMVALAVLMPIVASMGGNAATQTMTVAVRALATRDLDRRNLGRVLSRELIVSLMNGVLLALFIGALASWWFDSIALGGVLAVALVVNMIAAGLSGLLVPYALDLMGADPAVASGVFVTTVTDVVGFFAFLGLAAFWFGLW